MARPAASNPRPGADAPDNGAKPPPAKPLRFLQVHLTEGWAPFGRRLDGRAKTSPMTPAGWRLRCRVSGPVLQLHSSVLHPTAARSTRRGNPTTPAGIKTMAA